MGLTDLVDPFFALCIAGSGCYSVDNSLGLISGFMEKAKNNLTIKRACDKISLKTVTEREISG